MQGASVNQLVGTVKFNTRIQLDDGGNKRFQEIRGALEGLGHADRDGPTPKAPFRSRMLAAECSYGSSFAVVSFLIYFGGWMAVGMTYSVLGMSWFPEIILCLRVGIARG
jgi:hypothetical protein